MDLLPFFPFVTQVYRLVFIDVVLNAFIALVQELPASLAHTRRAVRFAASSSQPEQS